MINFTDIFWIFSLKGDNAQYKVYKCLGIKEYSNFSNYVISGQCI